jgi:hypothetical protein
VGQKVRPDPVLTRSELGVFILCYINHYWFITGAAIVVMIQRVKGVIKVSLYCVSMGMRILSDKKEISFNLK